MKILKEFKPRSEFYSSGPTKPKGITLTIEDDMDELVEIAKRFASSKAFDLHVDEAELAKRVKDQYPVNPKAADYVVSKAMALRGYRKNFRNTAPLENI